MTFDPTQPAENSRIESAPIRANWLALEEMIDALDTRLDVVEVGGGGGGGGGDPTVLDIRDFGAECDDVTDDTVAVQAAIDSVGGFTGAGVRRSGVVVLIPGPTVISDTVLLHSKSITLTGRGLGYRTGTVDPHATYLRWEGPAGIPMIRIQDNMGGAVVRDLHLIGKTTARPSAGISFYETDDGRGNVHNLVENVWIGATYGETDYGVQLDNGIVFEGPHYANNDSNMLRNVWIAEVAECGIRTNSVQHGGIVIDGLSVQGATYGIRNVGEIAGTSMRFYNCTGATLYFPERDAFDNYAFGQIHILEYISENCARLAECPGPCFLTIRGGYFQLTSLLNVDGQVIKADNNWIHIFTIESLRFTQASAPTTAPYLAIKAGVGGATSKHVTLRNIEGWTANMTGGPAANGLDVTTNGPTDRRYIDFHETTWVENAANKCAENNLLGAAGLEFDPHRRDFWQSVTFQAATPVEITADQNNYAPSKATSWRLSADAPRTITGLGGGSDGRILWLTNAGAHPITFAFDSASSAVQNRIYPTTLANYSLAAQGVVQAIYDASYQRWRLLAPVAASGAPSFPLLAPDGTATAPSYSFASEPFAGMSLYTGAGAGNAGIRLGDERTGQFLFTSEGVANASATVMTPSGQYLQFNPTEFFSTIRASQTQLSITATGGFFSYLGDTNPAGSTTHKGLHLTDFVAGHDIWLQMGADAALGVPCLATPPATPPSGYAVLYAKSDKKFYGKDDAGAETALSGGMLNPMVAAGDVIVGAASGTPARLAAGTNGHVLTLASGAPSWAAAPGGGAPSYPLLASDGTLAAPSYSFSAATNTGIARNVNAANEIALVVAGATAAYFANGYWVSYYPLGLGGADLWLQRDAANTLALRNLIAPTAAQAFRLYNTYTDASNGEWLDLSWASNVATLAPTKNGSGTVRALRIVQGPAVTITYSTSMTPDAALGNKFVITATNATAFAINAPTNPLAGQEMVITIRNTSGGALGTATWNAVFKMATWTQPATATSRSIAFAYNGTNWVELVRGAANVPN